MAKVNTAKARADIYTHGKQVPSEKTKSKTRLDRSQPRDENDKVLVAKGETYYWWKFRYSGKYISKTYPTPSQLTQNAYKLFAIDINERITNSRGNVSSPDEFESYVDDIKSEIESQRDELQEKLDNMPEGLRESSSSGEILQERIDNLENAISEIEGIDLSYDDPDEEEINQEYKEENEFADESDIEQNLEDKRNEHMNEWLDEKCEELNNISVE